MKVNQQERRRAGESTTGWVLVALAIGLMLVDLGNELEALGGLSEAASPKFIGTVIASAGQTVVAILGGERIARRRRQ